ncbi:MAG: hypothetical protein K0R05_2792 [Anaerocolumna sp.]|jgi:hypothetical protein|nr:hypothetical protein [Anaerocolumna sp.]
MDLEREKEETKWFRIDGLRIKQTCKGRETQVSVILDGYNICFKLMLFDFLNHIKEDLALDVKIAKIWNNQRVFMIDTKYASDLINYIVSFMEEWNIKISESTVSASDVISDELWYS